eukprot:SAG11_NODE_4494_length_1875_cov_1.214527_1_plen_152_part_00
MEVERCHISSPPSRIQARTDTAEGWRVVVTSDSDGLSLPSIVVFSPSVNTIPASAPSSMKLRIQASRRGHVVSETRAAQSGAAVERRRDQTIGLEAVLQGAHPTDCIALARQNIASFCRIICRIVLRESRSKSTISTATTSPLEPNRPSNQ